MKTAIVTGGSRGIGAAICARLRRDGLGVVVIDPRPPEHQDHDDYQSLDVADSQKLRELIGTLSQRHEIVALVNNAGVAMPADLEATTDEEMDRIFAVNLRAGIAATQAVVRALRRAGGGAVVNIGSRTALGKQRRVAYSASKAGVIGMTRTMALELAGDGITVNCVAPGPILTRGFERANPADSPATRKIVESVPLGRMGKPEEVADAVAYFLAARFVTGQVLYVCGGMTIGGAPV